MSIIQRFLFVCTIIISIIYGVTNQQIENIVNGDYFPYTPSDSVESDGSGWNVYVDGLPENNTQQLPIEDLSVKTMVKEAMYELNSAIQQLAAEVSEKIGELRVEFTSLVQSIDAKVTGENDQLRGEFASSVQSLHTKVTGEIGQLREEFTSSVKSLDRKEAFLEANVKEANFNLRREVQSSLGVLDTKISETVNSLKRDLKFAVGNITLKLDGKMPLPPKNLSVNVPTSCRDLHAGGQLVNGFYMVKAGKKMISVYCDFGKEPNGFETQIGQVDVKSSPVYFYVQRDSGYGRRGTIIPYHLERLNVGGAMNLRNGVFTAPRKGVYFFAFSAVDMNHSGGQVQLQLNGVVIGKGYGQANSVDDDTLTLQATLSLETGDQVSVLLVFGAIYDSSDLVARYTHFTGFLLEEYF